MWETPKRSSQVADASVNVNNNRYDRYMIMINK